MSRSLALSDDHLAQEIADEVLAAGGTALIAALSGFFAAAGASPGVLLAPVSLLVSGLGVGSRAYDGRSRQPGLGAKRPRGWLPEQQIPRGARAAIPAGLAACTVALAHHGGGSLTSVVNRGIVQAKRAGADGRVAVLERVKAVGPAALGEELFLRPILHVAGPSQGGLVTQTDLLQIEHLDAEVVERRVGDLDWLEAPWASVEDPPEGLGAGSAVLAMDSQGLSVGLTFRKLTSGLELNGLDLLVPELAQPVLRGVPRTRPASALEAPAPMALSSAEGLTQLVASPRAARIDPTAAELKLRRRSDRQVESFR